MDKTVIIRVKSDLYRGIKVRIAKEDITLKAYILDIVRRIWVISNINFNGLEGSWQCE